MKAITVEPKQAGSARFEDVPEPDLHNGSVLVEAIAVGICGTDVEIAEGGYGWAPPGKKRMVLGHESLGRVLDPGPASGLKKGDLVVGIVRRPDPVPCPNCAVGEWDMCRNGQYTERGIKEIDGYMSEHWRIEPEYAIKVDPTLGILGVLLEPTTVVTKAWEHILSVGQRAFWEPKTVLVTGAGPIGLLGAMIGRQLGLEVHVLDRTETGLKPDLVRALGGPTTPATWPMSGLSPTSSWNHRGRTGHRPVVAGHRRQRGGLPDRGRTRRRSAQARHGGCRLLRRAQEQYRVRQRQCQQTALVQGLRSAGPGGPGLAGPANHPGEKPENFKQALIGSRMTSRSSCSFPTCSRKSVTRVLVLIAASESGEGASMKSSMITPMNSQIRTQGRSLQ